MSEVKGGAQRRPSRISAKNQITVPVAVLRTAGLSAGDDVIARADGAGRIVLERHVDPVADIAGSLTGTYRPDELRLLRDEWG